MNAFSLKSIPTSRQWNIVEFLKKKNELSGHEKTWRNLKSTLLNERIQSERLHTT